MLTARFEAAGGVTALFGPSGAGKTTIVNMIAGLVTPDRGSIALDDTVLFDAATASTCRRTGARIGYVFQEGRLFPHLSVRQNLDYGRRMSGRAARCRTSSTRIVDAARHRPSARAAAAPVVGRRAPAHRHRPRLVDAPAPAAARRAAGFARQPPTSAKSFPIWNACATTPGVPMVYVSHHAAELRRIATTVVRLDAGQVVAARRPRAARQSEADALGG